MEKLKDLSEIKHDLIDAVKAEVAKGLKEVDTEELGEVVDMIKDLAEAEKACIEACYYETVTDAMTEEDGGERRGYDRWRYASGRYAPKGRGTYGYTPMHMGNWADGHTDTSNGAMRDGARTSERYGYHAGKDGIDGAIEKMGDLWTGADADERGKMKAAVKDLLYQMEQAE